MPHLKPIEEPKSVFMKAAYWASTRQFGKVITPMKVIYARKPALLGLVMKIQKILARKLSIQKTMVTLIEAQSALLNGCAFCHNLHEAQAMRLKIGSAKFRDLEAFISSHEFSPAEKAALTFTQKATRREDIDQGTFAALRSHFNEEQIVEIAWVNAISNYFNLMARPLGIESDHLE